MTSRGAARTPAAGAGAGWGGRYRYPARHRPQSDHAWGNGWQGAAGADLPREDGCCPPSECAPRACPAPPCSRQDAVPVGLETRTRTHPDRHTRTRTPPPQPGTSARTRLGGRCRQPPPAAPAPRGRDPPPPRPGRCRVTSPPHPRPCRTPRGDPSALGRGAVRGRRGPGMGAAEPGAPGGGGALVLRRGPPGPGKPAERSIAPVCASGPGGAGVTVRPSVPPPEPLRAP